MRKEEKKTCKFEDDLYYFVKIKNRYSYIFENYEKFYDDFVSKNKFDIEEKKTGEIKFRSTNEFSKYAKNNYKELRDVLDALIKFQFLNPQDVSTSIQFCLDNLTFGTKIKKFNSSDDIILGLKTAIATSNLYLLATFEWAIKSYVLPRGEKLKRRIQFVNDVSPIFKQYYNLKMNMEIIPEELINKISRLMMNNNFTIPSKNKGEDSVLALLKYTADFANYTKSHNLTVENNRKSQAMRDENKINSKTNKTVENKKIELKPVIIKEENEFELSEDLLNNAIIDNMVKAFFSGICAKDRNMIEDDMLPSKYDPNYNDIIIRLLNEYENYLSSIGKCTMSDFNKYNELSTMVEGIKEKS